MNNKQLAHKAANRMATTTRPKQTANTFFKHIREVIRLGSKNNNIPI